MLATNAAGVERVIGGAVRRGLPAIVYVSSAAIFFTPGGPPITPELPIVAPTTTYARSKVEAERFIRRLQEDGAPIRVSYPTGIVGPDDPGFTEANRAVWAWIRQLGVDTEGGFQIVDVRDVAALHVKLVERPGGACRYAAAAPMLSWPETHDTIERLIGRKLRRVRLSGRAFRAFGSAGDLAKRLFDFGFPLTRDAMTFATQWPGVDASRTTRELGVLFRPPEETYRDTVRWLCRAGHLSPASVGLLAA